ncbi:hypothetical protein JOE31_002741 [Arthrobacter sp. PvP023]|uniref:hypothetical protein n=1 Tax=Micrococcaceae TaxID=1268 RepID=UPI001AE60DA3|nr:hypothetical protein [Arthrobacter sp. PvP023]MBP1136509.1 hypothetical protein [Arthrobacter sp. PvP023]
MEFDVQNAVGIPVRHEDPGDLSGIVTNLARVTAKGRQKLANDPLTKAFLASALKLTEELFLGTPNDAEEVRPTMSYLSRPKVLAQTLADSPDLIPTPGKFRDRWTAHQHFLADFISYALTARHWSLHIALSRSAEEMLSSAEEFSDSVHRIAYEDLKLVLELPAYRFQLLAVASAGADSVASEALSRMYATLSEAWTALYTQIFKAHGVQFRPGISLETFNIILQATAEGLGMRLLAGVDEPILDHETRSTILGTAALGLYLGFVDPGDGLTVEEAAQKRILE